MKRSTNYSGADTGGWLNACDSLFLCRYRGLPCEVCGATSGVYNRRRIRSMGHHALSKELHRLFRYDPRNIIVLCPDHHLGSRMSPHSKDGVAVKSFYDWLNKNRPELSLFMDMHRDIRFDGQYTYRNMYKLLGGEVVEKGAMKYWKPSRHSVKISEFEGKGMDGKLAQILKCVQIANE